MFEDVKNWKVREGRTMRGARGGIHGPGVILPADHPDVKACPNVSDYCVPLDDDELPEEFVPKAEHKPFDIEADPLFGEDLED